MRRPIALAVTLLVSPLLDTPVALAVPADSTPSASRPGRTAQPPPRYVREAQRALRDLGYEPGPVDGVVGPKTRDALARYQRSERIAVTGRLDAETMVRLDIRKRVFPEQARAR